MNALKERKVTKFAKMIMNIFGEIGFSLDPALSTIMTK